MKGKHKNRHKPPAKPSLPAHQRCVGWDYETHPERPKLRVRCEFLINWIRRDTSRFDRYGLGLQKAHHFLFAPMVPKQCSCIAGGFRGDAACGPLLSYRVGVKSDLRVGTEPSAVATAMARFETECNAAFSDFRDWSANGGVSEPADVKLSVFVKLLALYLQQFLTIHPFANGNGHLGRFLVMLQIVRHNYSLGAWPLDDSPAYGGAITAHRDGDDRHLRVFIMMAMNGLPPPLRA